MSVKAGECGPVRILAGEYRGQLGYHDDDDGGGAVVYLAAPLEGPYTLIARRALAKVSVTPLRLERWKRTHPWLVERLGIP
jgi:hypothetical protein